ncbi:hypothetical protein V6N12_056614 [Hibiscus sabdariffa]|uniref:YdbS-like PH domain-containing protein n=1 Tax=Hibiscus sabdariffa TaxID=183260 RepID=A0ABR2CT09_9ROSI
MASTSLLSPAAIATPTATAHHSLRLFSKLPFPNLLSKPISRNNILSSRLHVSSSTDQPATTTPPSSSKTPKEETIFFDGGAHYGDLLANLLLGFTLLWLPLTLAAVSRAFFLRYRFTNLRVTVISGLTGQDRSDFSYKVIKDVQVVPRFIGEWGDVVITLKDGTKVDLRSVPSWEGGDGQVVLFRTGWSPNKDRGFDWVGDFNLERKQKKLSILSDQVGRRNEECNLKKIMMKGIAAMVVDMVTYYQSKSEKQRWIVTQKSRHHHDADKFGGGGNGCVSQRAEDCTAAAIEVDSGCWQNWTARSHYHVASQTCKSCCICYPKHLSLDT